MSPDERTEALKQIDQYAARDVAAAFRKEVEIVDNVTEVVGDEFDSATIRPLVVERVRHFFAEHQVAERNWPEITDCDRLDRAFASLESRGIVCRQDFSCCGTCGNGEIVEEMEAMRSKGQFVRGYSYYHMQDTEHAVEGHGVYLAYGAVEEGAAASTRIAHEICDALREAGLTLDWDGTVQRRVLVKLDWKRRRGPRCFSSGR